MKAEFENIPVVKNEEKERFEIEINGLFAFIDYKETSENIALVHTEVEPGLEGTGAAAAVVEKTLNFIKNSGKKLLPYCPYVFGYIKKHPEWKSIVSEKFPKFNEL